MLISHSSYSSMRYCNDGHLTVTITNIVESLQTRCKYGVPRQIVLSGGAAVTSAFSQANVCLQVQLHKLE